MGCRDSTGYTHCVQTNDFYPEARMQVRKIRINTVMASARQLRNYAGNRPATVRLLANLESGCVLDAVVCVV